jgi:hypothetical protein
MLLGRRLPAFAALAIAVAVAALGARALEAGDPAMFFRVVSGAVLLAAFVFGRRRAIAQRVALAVGLEVVLGSAVFVYVDLPFAVRWGSEMGVGGADLLWRTVHGDAPNRLSNGYSTGAWRSRVRAASAKVSAAAATATSAKSS